MHISHLHVAIWASLFQNWGDPTITGCKLFCIGEVKEIYGLVDIDSRFLQLIISVMSHHYCPFLHTDEKGEERWKERK